MIVLGYIYYIHNMYGIYLSIYLYIYIFSEEIYSQSDELDIFFKS